MSDPMDEIGGERRDDDRVLVTFILDTSDSMGRPGSGSRIDELNRAIRDWIISDVLGDGPASGATTNDFLRRKGEFAFLYFDNGRVRPVENIGTTATPPFVPASELRWTKDLPAGGTTPLGPATREALRLIEARKSAIRDGGLTLAFRPLLYIISDGVPTDSTTGMPTDDYKEDAQALRDAAEAKHVLPFAFGVDGAEFAVLREFVGDDNQCIVLKDTDFRTVLKWVSTSIGAANQVREQNRPLTSTARSYGGDDGFSESERKIHDVFANLSFTDD